MPTKQNNMTWSQTSTDAAHFGYFSYQQRLNICTLWWWLLRVHKQHGGALRAVNFAQAATGHRDGEAAEIFALLLTQVFLVFLPVIFLLGSVPINPSFTESISTAGDNDPQHLLLLAVCHISRVLLNFWQIKYFPVSAGAADSGWRRVEAW